MRTKGRAYVSGNVVHNSSADINRVGKESAPFPAAPVDTTDAATAACRVFHGAGVRPLDIIDQGLLKSIALPGCGTQGGVPSVQITAPASDSALAGTTTLSASTAGPLVIAAVQYFLDGLALGPELTTPPYAQAWNTATAGAGPHTLHARARDVAGNLAFSVGVQVTVQNGP
ncbi:MAG: Ig-like domain-containing protein [Deltaproteobacteria bacterium]|nr:Ig-like domain-containing protein [Deltaproteobacteria bacterium]